MGYPGEKTVVVPSPCIVSRGDVVNPVVGVDVDSLGALVLLIVDYPVDLRGVGFRGGVGSASKEQVAIGDLGVGIAYPNDLFVPGPIIIIFVDGNSKPNDITGFGVADGIQGNPKFSIVTCVSYGG